MSIACPHCGAPGVSDAYCHECRRALDEPPDAPRPPEQVRTEQAAQASGALWYLGWFLLFAGIIAGGANPPKFHGNVEDAVDLGFVVVGAGLLGLSYWLARRAKAARHRDKPGSSPPDVG